MLALHPTPTIEALLGTVSDASVAQQAGVSTSTVRAWRRARQIPSFSPSRATDWDAPVIRDRLGVVRDVELAAELGVSPSAVYLARRARNIPAVRADGWTPERVALLGRAPDREVAQRVGLSVNAVTFMRLQLGIAPHREQGGVELPQVLLGQVDYRARSAGVSRSEWVSEAVRMRLEAEPAPGGREPDVDRRAELIGLVVDVIDSHGPMSIRAMARHMPVSPTRVREVVAWAEDMGVIMAVPNGKKRRTWELG